jgi:hypothetical protein
MQPLERPPTPPPSGLSLHKRSRRLRNIRRISNSLLLALRHPRHPIRTYVPEMPSAHLRPVRRGSPPVVGRQARPERRRLD